MYNLQNQDRNFNPIAKITVIGVGGGGNNSVESMIGSEIKGVNFVFANTDKQVLDRFNPQMVIHLGSENRLQGEWGLGAGADPRVGEEAAKHSEEEIRKRLQGSHLIIITAGLGGGTGTGASPVVAKIAKELGALTIAIVTLPFKFEGSLRMRQATEGLERLKKEVDSIIIVSNTKLKETYGSLPLSDSFRYANTILKQAVRTITDIISKTALVNLDFADLKRVMQNKGNSVIGIGSASGENRAKQAAVNAVSSGILLHSVIGATSAIVNITMSAKHGTLDETEEVVDTIKEIINGDGQQNIEEVLYGVVDDEKVGDEIYVSVIATGLKVEAADIVNKPKSAQEIQSEVQSILQNSNNESINKLHTQELSLEQALHLSEEDKRALKTIGDRRTVEASSTQQEVTTKATTQGEKKTEDFSKLSFFQKLKRVFSK